MKKRMCSKSLCFLIVGSILILAVPAVLSESYSYSKNYEDETYTYANKADYEYNKYVKYDYTNSYYSYYDSYDYKNYDYVFQNFLYRMFERYPVLEKLFDRFF